MATATDTITGFACSLRRSDVPDWVAARIRTHIVDTIGCGVAGAHTSLTAQIRRFVALAHGPGPCPLLGGGAAPAPGAAFANAVAMNALDYDDGLELGGRGLGHPGATIIAAALAACAGRQVTGERFLLAVIAAYEVNARIILSMQPSIERFREVYGVCQHQAVGAAIAFGLLAGLEADELENAVGLAGTAAAAGVTAVMLHGVGIVGARDVLGAESGLWRMLGSDRFDFEQLVGQLGKTWWLAQTSLKPYPACRWMHTTLEAFDTLRAEIALPATDIDRIVVHASAGLARDFMDPSPATMVDAQFSLPYALAMLACDEPPGAGWFTEAIRSDPAIRALADRVVAVVDPAVDAAMTGQRRPVGRVSIKAAGRVWQSPLIECPLGGPERPIDPARLRAKASANLGTALGPDRAESMLWRLERIDQEAEISALLGACMPCAADRVH